MIDDARSTEVGALAMQSIAELHRGTMTMKAGMRAGRFAAVTLDLQSMEQLCKMADRAVAELVRENSRLRKAAAR